MNDADPGARTGTGTGRCREDDGWTERERERKMGGRVLTTAPLPGGSPG